MSAVSLNTRRIGNFKSNANLTGIYGAQDGFGRFMTRAVPAAGGAVDPWSVQICTASNVQIRGVLQNRPNVGEGASLALGDIVQVRAGAAITAGARIMCGPNGSAIPFVQGSGNIDLGEALDAATAPDQMISVLMNVVFSNQSISN